MNDEYFGEKPTIGVQPPITARNPEIERFDRVVKASREWLEKHLGAGGKLTIDVEFSGGRVTHLMASRES